MGQTLTDIEQTSLVDLGEKIKVALECDTYGTGLPCKSDRLDAVKHMIAYITLHDYEVTE